METRQFCVEPMPSDIAEAKGSWTILTYDQQ